MIEESKDRKDEISPPATALFSPGRQFIEHNKMTERPRECLSAPSETIDSDPSVLVEEKGVFIDRLSELSYVQDNNNDATVDQFLEEAILSLRDEK